VAERFTTRISVFVILENDKGELLLQRRMNTGYLDGYYDQAASGHLELGETLQECAVRETKEEIGIDILPADLKLVHINQNNIDIPYINFTFQCSQWNREPRICEPDKCDDIQFFAKDDLPEKCTLNVRLLEREGFKSELTYSYVDPASFAQLVG
jgi:8-oxo-dGTP diphosphatase